MPCPPQCGLLRYDSSATRMRLGPSLLVNLASGHSPDVLTRRAGQSGTCSYYDLRIDSLAAEIRILGVHVSSANSLTVDELGSAAQRDRRKRILDATYELASDGGFDAVQMRAVAD